MELVSYLNSSSTGILCSLPLSELPVAFDNKLSQLLKKVEFKELLYESNS